MIILAGGHGSSEVIHQRVIARFVPDLGDYVLNYFGLGRGQLVVLNLV